MKFKDTIVEGEYYSEKVDNRIRMLVRAVDAWMRFRGFPECTVTDILRNDPKSVHHYGRGCDIRTIGVLDNEEAQELAEWITAGFPYGKGKVKTARYEIGGQRNPNGSTASADHIHLQVKAK